MSFIAIHSSGADDAGAIDEDAPASEVIGGGHSGFEHPNEIMLIVRIAKVVLISRS